MEEVTIRIYGEEEIDEFNYRLDYSVLRKICHRIPERSFFVFGRQLPLCARCLGIYTAFFLGIILFTLNLSTIRNYTWYDSALIISLMITPTAVDGFTQLFGLRESNNILRLTTGLLAGLGFSFMFLYISNILL